MLGCQTFGNGTLSCIIQDYDLPVFGGQIVGEQCNIHLDICFPFHIHLHSILYSLVLHSDRTIQFT